MCSQRTCSLSATVKTTSATIILEPFLRRSTQSRLDVWIREGDPVTAEDAARLAESFMSARRRNQDVTFSQENQQAQSGESFVGEEGSGQPQKLYFSQCRQFSLQTASHEKKVCSHFSRKLDINIWLPFFGQ